MKDYPDIIVKGKQPSDTVVIDESSLLTIRFDDIRDSRGRAIVQERIHGELKEKCFFLNDVDFEWHLGYDPDGALVLVPTKKK